MIDIRKIEENPAKVKELLANKLYDVDFDELLAKNKRKKELIAEVESNKAEQNKLSKAVPQWKKEGKDVTILTIGATLYRALDAAKELEEKYHTTVLPINCEQLKENDILFSIAIDASPVAVLKE